MKSEIPHIVGFLPGRIFFTPPPTFFNCWSWCQKKFHHCEEFFKKISNPALWGILKWKVRQFFNFSFFPFPFLCFWWHLWDLWHFCQWWFGSSLVDNSSQCWFFTWINPTLWGIFQKLFISCIVRNFEMKSETFLTFSSQSWIFKIFRASDDTIEIFDIDANDDLVQACRKFLTMLDFYLDKSNIVRNFEM